MPPEARLALLALAVRAFVLLATTSLDAALPDYDSSKHITPASPPPASWADAGDAATSARLQRPNTAPSMQGWVVWDSVFYADIGARGYVFEQYYAFFPGFPGLMALLAPPRLFAPVALLANAAATAGSTVLLYRLGVRLLHDPRLAALACLFFAVANPATVFHAAPYTEPAFTLASLAALYLLYCRGRVWLAAAAVAASCALRSNGIVSAGYLGHYCLVAAVAAWAQGRKACAVALACKAVLAAAVSVLPLLLFQRSALVTFCHGHQQWHYQQDERVAVVPEPPPGLGGWPRRWCTSAVPQVYGFVQSQYWGVGLLRYYTLSQAPNFLLAAPVLLLSIAGIWEHCAANGGRALRLALEPLPRPPPLSAGAGSGEAGTDAQQQQQQQQLREGPAHGEREEEEAGEVGSSGRQKQLQQASRGAAAAASRRTLAGLTQRRRPRGEPLPLADVTGPGRPPSATQAAEWGGHQTGGCSSSNSSGSSGSGYLCPALTVFMYPWAFSLAVALLAMHVQVATRLLSCSPQLYWYMAHVAAAAGSAGAAARDGTTSAVSHRGRGLLLRGAVGPLVWRWCFVYAALGCVLFVNFLPWT